MGEKCNTITLYASQADPVIEAIERNGVCYSKEAYVRKKYQESAKIFTTAYSWFVREMEKYVKKPDGAEYIRTGHSVKPIMWISRWAATS